MVKSTSSSKSNLVCDPDPPPVVISKTSYPKRIKDVTKYIFITVFPPVLISFLLKSTALLTGGVVLFQGISFFTWTDTLSPVVMTLDGPVQGNLAYSRNGSGYWQYLSIPYAQPPVGPLRFQPPVPVKPWKEVRQSVSYPPACAQFDPVALGLAWGIEDCLFLNVFVPAGNSTKIRSSGKGKPVLVYIHGGAFLEGQSSFYRPDNIMDHQDVVMVTLNYRVGPLGFLNFQQENETSGRYPRGNMGLKDQNLVLQWIQKNIGQFGGDPNRVTIMADSAGAVSLHLHMLSPLSRGLFHRAIPISGSAHCPWGFTENPRKIAFSYGRRLGCPSDDADSLLQCYMKMDPHELAKLQYSWSDPLHEKDEFVPSVETGPRTKDTFLSDTPLEILDKGKIADVPMLAGVTSGEGGLRSGRFQAMPELVPVLDQNWEQLVDKVLFLDEPMSPELAKQLRQYYFGKANFTESTSSEEFFQAITKLTSDALFVVPTHRAAVYHAKRGNPTYLFYFDYRSVVMPSPLTVFRPTRLSDNFVMRVVKLLSTFAYDWVTEYVFRGEGSRSVGVGHAEPLFQIFNMNGLTYWFAWLDKDFSINFIQSITDFVHDLKPLTYRGVPWPQINNHVESHLDGIPYMNLDNSENPTVIPDPFKERMKFWEMLRSKYGSKI